MVVPGRDAVSGCAHAVGAHPPRCGVRPSARRDGLPKRDVRLGAHGRRDRARAARTRSPGSPRASSRSAATPTPRAARGPGPSVDACHISTIGVPRTSRRTSARRRTSSTTECGERQHDPLARRGRRDRRGAATRRSTRAGTARGARRTRRCPRTGRATDDEPVLVGEVGRGDEPAGERVRRRGDDDQPAAQERRRGDRCGASGRGRARCPRAGARAPRRTTRPAARRPTISSPSSRAVNSSISGPMCSATSAVAATTSRRDSEDSATERRACSASPRISRGQRGQPPAARRQRDPAAVAHEQLVAQLLAQSGDRDATPRAR